MNTINEILEEAVKRRVSDIFIVAGAKLCFKIKGEIETVGEQKLMPQDTERLITEIYALKRDRSLDELNKKGEDDFAFSLNRLGRFRANVYYQRGSIAAVLRVVRFEMPDPKEYKIPESVLDLSKLNKGLVLVTGSAGSGKSTTLTCIIDRINHTKKNHIITIEDPIEYLHTHDKSIVSQREVENDTSDYIHALRAALREAPNVILVGEMRDLETISVALSAAETGHLVLSTLHTMSAKETINRIIDVFPAQSQQQIRVQLSMVLQSVVSQQLIPSKDGLVPAFEIMNVNNAIRTMIRENKLQQIDNAIASGKNQGMVTMDDSLIKLVKEGIITKEDALNATDNPEILARKI